MDNVKIFSKNNSKDEKRTIISLIAVLVGFTILYQFRPFLDDHEFMWISVFSYAVAPGSMAVLGAILTVKLYRQKHFQAKATLFFTLGAGCRLFAEQIWAFYDHVLDVDPFPSEADIFFIAAYPFFILFLVFSLKPVFPSVSRNVLLFAIGLSVAVLIPSFTASYDDISGEESFSVYIALSYPIMSSIQLVPAIIGILFLTKKGAHLSWMLILFGFIVESISDTVFLFTELDGTYYDGHPVDLIFVYSFILLTYAMYMRLKTIKSSSNENPELYFSENIRFETISKFGVPLTVAIVCMVILISLIHTVFIQTDEALSTQNLILGIASMLGVFIIIIITLNRNLSNLVQMRTRELTEQRDNLENLVEEKTEELLKSERLSAIGELSGRLAHDLRNPLSVMRMSIDLIKQSPEDSKISDEKFVKRLDLMEKSIERISHQVDDVLGYVRISPLKLSNVLLSDIVKNSFEKVNVPKDVSLKISDSNLCVDCDPIKLDAVFINLIVNSIQAMPNGGKIEIKIHEKDDMAILEFIDSGPGIPEEDLPKVFEPLFTTKQKGTGLGLASCKNIVEQHDGEISVKNNPTTFTVMLPKSR